MSETEQLASRLEFRLLGPLEVWRDGRPLRLGGKRQRALLALLLVHANEVVPSDRLIDELFGGQASETAANALQAGVSRLRRTLEDGAAGRVIVTRSPGYALQVAPEQVDLARFERLLEEGRRQLSREDPLAASATLREALALWRGPPLADLGTQEFAERERRRLGELRLATVMERIGADLALGRGSELASELEQLITANPYQERLRGQLMLALYRSGRQAEALATYRETRRLMQDELGLEPSRALQELEKAILVQDPALDPATVLEAAVVARPTDDETAVFVCPFKGLAPFEAADSEYFFGRERLVGELVARLVGARFLAIVGPSGSGKSSLVRAGLLPALAAGALPGSERWRRVLVRPGEHPVEALARPLGAGLPEAVGSLGEDERLLVVVDQFEEAFTVCRDEQERLAFIDSLAGVGADADGRATAVVALRADFYGRLAAFPCLAELASANHVLLSPMSEHELRRAIELPAERAGLRVEPELVDALASDVVGEPGGLPLLSTALLELWQQREHSVLTLAGYRQMGGVHRAVAGLAEQAYARLSEQEQQATRHVMLRLASGSGETVVRRRIPLQELDAEHDEAVARALAVLTASRLLTASEGTIEVSHEALLHEWPRLAGWLEEDAQGRRLREHLTQAARDWEHSARDPGELYRGARLASVLDWTSEREPELNRLERDFVEASRASQERELRRQRRQNRRLRSLLALVALLFTLVLAAGVIALVQRQSARDRARIALARQLGSEAVVEPRIDRAMLLAKEAVNLDPSPQTQSTLLATLLRSPAALATFTLPIDVRPQRLALSPDGRTLAVSDNQDEVRFYDTRTRREERPPLTGHSGSSRAPIYSNDGSLLLLYADGEPPFIDVLDGHTLERLVKLAYDHRWLTSPTIYNQSLFLSPDRRTVYLAYAVQNPDGSDGPAYLDRWSLPSGRLLSTTPVGLTGLLGAGLVDSGKRLVVVGNATAAVLDRTGLRRLASAPVPNPGQFGGQAAINPDGRTVAVGSQTGAVSFVDLTTRRVAAGLGGHNAAIQGIAYSPDGRLLVTTGADDKVVVWDPGAARPVEILAGHGGRPLGIAFSTDGRTLYTCALDGAILEWDLGRDRRFGRPFGVGAWPTFSHDAPGPPPLAISADGTKLAARAGAASVALISTRTLEREGAVALPRGRGPLTALAWSPAGSRLAVAGEAGAVELWNVAGTPRLERALEELRPRAGLSEAVQAVAFSSDGRILAAVDLTHPNGPGPPDGRLAIWRVGSGQLITRRRDLGQPGSAVAFSPDGSALAVAVNDGTVLIVDPATGRVRRTLHPRGGNGSLAFAPNGTLATGSDAGIVQLWNVSTGREVGHPVLVAAAPVASISFDPSGARFATTGGSDGTVKLWATATLEQEGTTLENEQGTWGTAGFTPDGRHLVVVHDDGKGYLWPVSPQAWEAHACAVAGRNLTREEWTRFVSGHSYTPACSRFPAGR